MNETRVMGMLGLALRARQAALGADTCERMIRSGKCGVLLIDGDASENTRRKAEGWCRKSGTRMVILPAGMIAEATGKDNMAIGISKGSFADRIRGEMTEDAEA